ncbi:MAG: hypothetical protein R2778_11880 [Saprospiraceae bacterium]
MAWSAFSFQKFSRPNGIAGCMWMLTATLADKKIVPAPTDNPTPEEIAAATCNLNEFIYFKLNKEAADYINAQDSNLGCSQAVAGVLALLEASHALLPRRFQTGLANIFSGLITPTTCHPQVML